MFHYTLLLFLIKFYLKIAWQQHDVQELCRVMFDALEQKWKQTEQVIDLRLKGMFYNKSFISNFYSFEMF